MPATSKTRLAPASRNDWAAPESARSGDVLVAGTGGWRRSRRDSDPRRFLSTVRRGSANAPSSEPSPRRCVSAERGCPTPRPGLGAGAARCALVLLVGALALTTLATRADEESDLIATLQSPATTTQKSAACQRLRIIGTVHSVPVLASLLTDEKTAHAARHALEGLPFPEAGDALRAALATTTGRVQAGVIDSLGWRGEPSSVEPLVPFLTATNLDLAVSAATALGRIDGVGGIPPLVFLNGLAESAPGTQGSLGFRTALQESLLRCADRVRDRNENDLAVLIYQSLFAKPASESLRVAAWRGLVLTDANHRHELTRQALTGEDHSLQLAALGFVRASRDVALLSACLADWSGLPAPAQLALLDAQVASGAPALPTIRQALASPHLGVRVAALGALADQGDPSTVPLLAQAAATGEPAARAAARQSLARARGPGVREALLAHLDTAESRERIELLRALGERGDRPAADVLLRYAAGEALPVRVAALESLQRLALPDTLTPLLELALESNSESQLDPVFRALSAVCQASPDKSQAESRVIDTIRKCPPAQRPLLLPLLAELGTADALTAAQSVTRDADPEVARQAVRVLTQWPNAAPASYLVDLAQSSSDPTFHALALRGGIQVSSQEPDAAKRLALLDRALNTAHRAEEKRLALAQVAQLPSPEALEVALKELANPDLVDEAGLAAVAIAEKLAPGAASLADEAAVKVLASCQAPETVRRAWALRRAPAAAGGFIRDWLVCGPFRQAGVEGAPALFDLAFGPEKPGEKVDWKPVSSGDHIDLAHCFPDQANCVAYLRAQILAPADLDALLLMGSDDGIKAWLNGEVVHSHNVDRGMVVDQDRAPIKLKPGTNLLLLKVTQGGGGWAACARILSATGQPIDGLRVEIPDPRR